MKKAIFLFLMLPYLGMSQVVTTIIDFDNGSKGPDANPCLEDATCFFGTGPRTVSNKQFVKL
jgi:hypothetical protein